MSVEQLALGATVNALLGREVVVEGRGQLSEVIEGDLEVALLDSCLMAEQQFRDADAVLDAQAVACQALLLQFDTQQVVAGRDARLDGRAYARVELVELSLHDADRLQLLLEGDQLPEILLGGGHHFVLGQLQLQRADVAADAGQFVAVDDLPAGEDRQHGRYSGHLAAIQHLEGDVARDAECGEGREGRQRDVGLQHRVARAEDGPRGGDLREIVGKGLLRGLGSDLYVERPVPHLDVVFEGQVTALFERVAGLRRQRGGGKQSREQEQVRQTIIVLHGGCSFLHFRIVSNRLRAAP